MSRRGWVIGLQSRVESLAPYNIMLPAYPVIMEWISTFYERGLQGRAAGVIGLISRTFTVALASATVAFISGPTPYFAFSASISVTAILVALLLPSGR